MRTVIMIWAAMSMASCGGGDSEGTGRSLGAIGSPCSVDSECTTSLCFEGYCSLVCTTSEQCAPFQCGFSADGISRCIRGCVGSYACVDGTPIHCDLLDDTWCEHCACPAGLRCDPGVGCLERSEVGGSCRFDSDCRTDNCSSFAHVCRVAVGQPCTDQDCDRCLSSGDWSFCSRECDGDYDCNHSRCLGYEGSFFHTCQPTCSSSSDSSCPGGRCDVFTSGTDIGWFCACSMRGDCEVHEATRQNGDECYYPSQCAGRECLGFEECGGTFGDDCTLRGYCSSECATDDDCGSGLRCVDYPCPDGQISQCGLRCLPACSADADCTLLRQCRGFVGPAGESVLACEPRLDAGRPCRLSSTCSSGRCVDGRCVSSSGAPNGDHCAVPTDCQSSSCISGICRGSALIGDPCSMEADCAAGTCCGGTCESSC